MASTQTNSTSKNKKLNYEEFEYDVEKMPPVMREGKFKFTIDRTTVGKTKSNGDDKIDMKMKVIETLDDGDDCEGKSIYYTQVFYRSNDSGGAGPSKRALRQLCEASETDLSDVPKKINPEVLEEFAALMKGKEFTGWIIHETQKDSEEVQARIRFVEPSDGGLSLSGGGTDEEERPAKKTSGSKKTARR